MSNLKVEKLFIKREIGLFLLLATLFSWFVSIIILLKMPADFKTGNVKAVENLVGNWPMIFGFGPFIAAIICTVYFQGKTGIKALFASVVRWKVPFYWYLLSLVLPIISHWIGLILWSRYTNTVLELPSLTAYLSSWLQIAFISSLFFISEELGWRGYLLPRILGKFSWLKASIIVGIIWGIWHYPLWLTSYWATTGSWSQAVLMILGSTIFTIGLSFLLTFIFKNTYGSVLLAMLLHGSNNANMGKMYALAGNTALFSSSFLIIQAMALAVFVICFFGLLKYANKRRKILVK